MELSRDDVFKIIKLVEESGYDEVRLEIGDFKLCVQKHGAGGQRVVEFSGTGETGRGPAVDAPRPVPTTAMAASPAPASRAEEPFPEGAVVVRAPMLGTFYRAPAPGERPFVEVGSKVAPDDTLCLVEVMKLFNSIKAGVAGRVVGILAENATMVEHGQPLMVIVPGRDS